VTLHKKHIDRKMVRIAQDGVQTVVNGTGAGTPRLAGAMTGWCDD
jgi:hypothetical protein